MKQRQIILRFLFPTRQDTAKPVHPAMCSLDNPASSFEASLMLNRLCLFTARANMSSITKFFHQVSYLTRVITFIKTHTLFFSFGRLWPFHRNTFYGRIGHFAIMSISSINRQAHRDTRTFRKQTAFNAFFGSVRRVGAGFFPRLAGLWSWHHPSIAKTSQYLSIRRSLPRLSPRASGIRPLGSILEIVSGRYCWNKYRFRLTRSIDNRFAIRKISRPWPCDPVLSVCRHQSDACLDAWVSRARFFPIIRLKFCIGFFFFVFSSLYPFKGIMPLNISAVQGLFG